MSSNVWQKRFKRERKLADTLQGHIYLASDLQHGNRRVVVKETYKTLVDTGKSRDGHVVHEDFHNETRILTYLSKQPDADEGFCRIILEWESDDCFYYAMQFCEAELFKHISNSFAASGTMFVYMKKETNKTQVPCDKNDAHAWLSEVRGVFRQCVQCVYYMHVKGICHLDLSLENTMIFKVDGLKVKIIDFGLAKHYDYKNNEKHANFLNDKRVGKRGYMAPEVYNKMIYDARRADIWSLGVMLFMMLVGAPPYKRATQRDAAFNYIINGMLEDVLKHWRRLRLISRDALDCMDKIFKWEKDRINMEQLVQHPFVDLAHLLHDDSDKTDPEKSYVRITAVVCEYHNKYALPMQAQYNKDGGASEHKSQAADAEEDDSAQLIKFTTDAISKSDKLILPKFGTACKEIVSYGNVQLLDDFNHILQDHSNESVKHILSHSVTRKSTKSTQKKPVIDASDAKEESDGTGSGLSELYESLLNGIKNKAFIHMDNSIIIRRCFRNRRKCEDEKTLLEVYGKYNKNVINDDGHRMAMQIMDKIYLYFAYTYNFGYTLSNDEIKQLTFVDAEEEKEDKSDGDNDVVLFKVKQLLKRKKQEILKTKHGKQIYNVLRSRKAKYCTGSRNCFSDEIKEENKQNHIVPGACIKIFDGIKGRMQQYLLNMKNAPKTMSHREFIKFLRILQIRCKKEERFASLKAIPTDQWKALINKFDSLQMSEAYFNGMSKMQFGNALRRKIATGYIVKLHKVITEELIRLQSVKFFTKKELISECDNTEIVLLLLAALRETDQLDIENDLNIDIVKKNLSGLSGADFMHLDEEYVIEQCITSALCDKFGVIDAHRFGKRFRYWPAYSDNKTSDLLNGFYTHHWYVRPKFNDIKDEILNNGICSITVNQWNRTVLFASKIVIRTVAIKKLKAIVESNKKDGGSTSNSSYNKYGVKNNDKIRLEHLVPLIIYINLDFVSKQMLNTYNNNNYVHNEYSQWIKYMKNHSQLSHLARLVRETVECYGECGEALTLYHLVDKSIASSSMQARFFSPTSMTKSLNAAFILNDFNDNEVVFELSTAQSPNLRYFNCSFLSDWPNEYEYIVCGGLGTLDIVNVYDLCLSVNYIYHMQAIDILLNTINNKMPYAEGVYDDNTIQGIGKCLNALMQTRYKNKKNADMVLENYMDNMFRQICENVCYAQINMDLVLESPLMRAVLCNKDKSIRFEVLCAIFPNIERCFIVFDEFKDKDIVFSDSLSKFLAKKELKGIKFNNVSEEISSSEDFKNYKDALLQNGYELLCNVSGGITTLSIDEIEK